MEILSCFYCKLQDVKATVRMGHFSFVNNRLDKSV